MAAETQAKFPLGKLLGTAILIIAVIVVSLCAFVVEEGKQAVVTRFGKPVRVIAGAREESEQERIRQQIEDYNTQSESAVRLDFGAGLYFKIPFMDVAEEFESRLLQYDAPPADIMTLDKKQLVMDVFARWRISNPLLFRQSVTNETMAKARLKGVIDSVMRAELAQYNFNEIIRTSNLIFEREREDPLPELVTQIEVGRSEIMKRISELCDIQGKQFGVRITDVRSKQANLPDENRLRVYARMNEERKRIATRWKEQGKAEALRIQAETDREVTVMIAEAEREKQILMGQGDAEAMGIYARGFEDTDAEGGTHHYLGYESDPEFFKFMRRLKALETISDVTSTTFILSTDSELLGVLKSSTN